jgi:subtilisin family serine protease
VLVGVVDTGIDVDHPEFAGKIAGTKSFVGGSVDDTIGHGTFVAGEIAAALDNGQGIAGIAFPARLLVAKVVSSDGTIDPVTESKAIRWLVSNGARVINLSLGALRDPTDPSIDAFSPAEAAAVRYATGRGAVVVAAVGNGDDSPSSPWHYASYPAALPHVIGVSAIAPDGSVPVFSNRDVAYNDISAPGSGILSTFPRSLTAERPTCFDQGYSDCGTRDYRDGAGTSFAAPQVTATAALLLASDPALQPSQISNLLERSADDVSLATGCSHCSVGRDSFSGWGSLDVAAAMEALSESTPSPDRLEPNDDAGTIARKVWGRSPIVKATLDYWDDPVDVYSVKLARGQSLSVALHCARANRLRLVLWKPGTKHVVGTSQALNQYRALETRAGPRQAFSYRVPVGGWYAVQVKMAAPGAVAYSLHIDKS